MRLHKTKTITYGFTLVEVLAVISIMALLAALLIGLQSRVKGKAEESRLNTELAAIELAVENYKAVHGNYPPSRPWAATKYPAVNWGSAAGGDNQLYWELVESPISQNKKPFLPDVKDELYQGKILLASVSDGRNGARAARWNYNSYDPVYNKGSYDLWVEFGDWGEDGQQGTPDDIVKIISNWNQ